MGDRRHQVTPFFSRTSLLGGGVNFVTQPIPSASSFIKWPKLRRTSKHVRRGRCSLRGGLFHHLHVLLPEQPLDPVVVDRRRDEPPPEAVRELLELLDLGLTRRHNINQHARLQGEALFPNCTSTGSRQEGVLRPFEPPNRPNARHAHTYFLLWRSSLGVWPAAPPLFSKTFSHTHNTTQHKKTVKVECPLLDTNVLSQPTSPPSY